MKKDQEGLPVSVRESSWLGSTFGSPISSFPKVWSCCNSKQIDFDPILSKRSKTFYPGIIKYLRPRTKFLERDCWKNYQYRGKNITTTTFKDLRNQFKVSPREQTCKKGEERLRKD